MALPKLDAFTDTDGVRLFAHNASWTAERNSNNAQIFSNKLRGATENAGLTTIYRWAGDTFSNDQYAQGVVAQVGMGYQGVVVRWAAGSQDGYYSLSQNADRAIVRTIAGSDHALTFDAGALVANDLQRLEMSGNVISLKVNGSTIQSTTDNTFTSGYAGLTFFDNATTTEMDDWEGGNLASAPIAPPTHRRPFMFKPGSPRR